MIVLVVMIMGMRVCDHAVRMLMAVRRAGRNRRLMGMIVVGVVVGVLMCMGDGIVAMCVRMLKHKNLPGVFSRLDVEGSCIRGFPPHKRTKRQAPQMYSSYC